jgi:16S rRNA (guanine966-N2)-methyltransferase
MAKFRKGRDLNQWKTNRPVAGVGKLRIVGGKFRGRQITYSGDAVTRPMKDNTREALFNLVGGWVTGKACFDLFAGTGAVAIESLSRGATRAFLVERHFPTLKIIQENIDLLDPELPAEVCGGDSFFWSRQFLQQPDRWPAEPWIVFICPPYALFQSHSEELLAMIEGFLQAAPPDSLIVVESDQSFDSTRLPLASAWDSRLYAPAVLSVYKKFQ